MRKRDTDKEQLVRQKTIELIVKSGLEGFSMNKLARACDISVATLYIYYKDRDDLILSIAIEEGRQMEQALIKNFDPNASFEQGLRIQWQNRYHYMTLKPEIHLFFEQLRNSSYQSDFISSFLKDFKIIVSKFMDNVVARGEINKMPFEVYWSIAFSPLYSLSRFHNEGKSIGGKPFRMTDEILWGTFDLVIKALKK